MSHLLFNRGLAGWYFIVEDGSIPTPLSLSITLTEGELNWGSGNKSGTSFRFSSMWLPHDGPDPLEIYEAMMFIAAGTRSTSKGLKETLRFTFEGRDANGDVVERLTFAEAYRESLALSEGDDRNILTFRGRDLAAGPQSILARAV